MTISLGELETLLGEAVGAVRSDLVTSSGGSSTTFVDTELQDYFLTDTALPTGWARSRLG